jgi:hypothetical protein
MAYHQLLSAEYSRVQLHNTKKLPRHNTNIDLLPLLKLINALNRGLNILLRC